MTEWEKDERGKVLLIIITMIMMRKQKQGEEEEALNSSRVNHSAFIQFNSAIEKVNDSNSRQEREEGGRRK